MSVSESIFSGKTVVVPMAEVIAIEKQHKKIYETPYIAPVCVGIDYGTLNGVLVITSGTKWNFEHDCWENAIWIGSTDNQAQEFLKAWCYYRYEVEALPEPPEKGEA